MSATTRILALLAAVHLWLAASACAHNLDEYVQATTVAVDGGQAVLRIRLTPGVAVSGTVVATIDADGDGVISELEQQIYAERVRRDLMLTSDGAEVTLRLTSSAFPTTTELRDGTGVILLGFTADLPPGGGDHRLGLVNHHQHAISVYLVNCLAPADPAIRVTAQERSQDQAVYHLAYTRAGAPPADGAAKAPLPVGGGSLFLAFLRLGMHHILTGYDHLLFVSALVLATTTLWDLLKVVSAFTLAHTITFLLAAFNLVNAPSLVVEPLIAASIVVIAAQNVFLPERARGWSRLGAAFFFGLFHGLGFAGGLLDALREMQSGTMLLAILAFSVGVELGHHLVVLPLFGLLKALRHTQPDATTRGRVALRVQLIGSACILVAGLYYLGMALTGRA